MFGLFGLLGLNTNTNDSYKDEYLDLIEAHEELRDKYASLKQKNKNLNEIIEKIETETRGAEVSIDFEKMNAFSIERILKEGIPITNIGYIFKSEDEMKVKEWCFYCDIDQHNRLVEEFKAYKGL